MRSVGVILLIVGSLGYVSSFAAEAAPAAESGKTALGDNAALQYWQAFAHMPTLDKDQEKLVAEWSTVSLDDPAVQKIVADSQNSMKFLRRASRLKQCDWGLDYNEGISLMLPQLVRSRDLARLAALCSRYDFEHGNEQALAENATGMMVLARHVGQDPFLICLAVQYALEDMTIDLVARYVPEIKVPHAKAVEMFNAMPAAATLHDSILAEKRFIAPSIIKQLRDADKNRAGGWRELWNIILQGTDAPQELKDIQSLDEVVKLVDDFFATYDEFAPITSLTKQEFDAKYGEFERRLTSASPITVLLLPTVDKLADKQYRLQARMSMLLAAIAVSEGGPDKLKDIRDPFGEGPFEYRPLENGYELTSKLIIDGKPVTLTVGRAKK